MKFFVRVDGRLISYQGMSEETIIAMLTEQGLVAEFIDEATYLAELAALENR
jgi:hypothetical protein